MTPIRETEDVTEELLDHAYAIFDGYYADERIVWTDFLDRLEQWGDVDLGSAMDSPAIKLIQKKVQKHRKEAS